MQPSYSQPLGLGPPAPRTVWPPWPEETYWVSCMRSMTRYPEPADPDRPTAESWYPWPTETGQVPLTSFVSRVFIKFMRIPHIDAPLPDWMASFCPRGRVVPGFPRPYPNWGTEIRMTIPPRTPCALHLLPGTPEVWMMPPFTQILEMADADPRTGEGNPVQRELEDGKLASTWYVHAADYIQVRPYTPMALCFDKLDAMTQHGGQAVCQAYGTNGLECREEDVRQVAAQYVRLAPTGLWSFAEAPATARFCCICTAPVDD